MLSLNKKLKGTIFSTDVPGAYLNVPIDEIIYVSLTKEISDRYVIKHPQYKKFLDSNGTLIVKLNKYLYGLKQSGLKFSNHLDNTLINDAKLNQSKGDVCFFFPS